jgi:hypothetical protein
LNPTDELYAASDTLTVRAAGAGVVAEIAANAASSKKWSRPLQVA